MISKNDTLRTKTIADFGEQWSIYPDNEGWYGSLNLFIDIVYPLLDIEKLKGTYVAEIGGGTGRIVGMLLNADVEHIYTLEPSDRAFRELKKNVQSMDKNNKVTVINTGGENWTTNHKLDYVFSIGVIHHIPDPNPVIRAAYDALKPGGYFFVWVYGYEGNELYLKIVEPIRKITTQIHHRYLKTIVEIMYRIMIVYRYLSKIISLPLRSYIDKIWWPLTPKNRRLVIFDQLNPSYSKYYKKEDAIQLLKNEGFNNIKIHNRHGYSWSILGQKPEINLSI
ncbi:MAG: class I SAM-dependent methyltransferase [Candidatus Omnitrophota bacterium]